MTNLDYHNTGYDMNDTQPKPPTSGTCHLCDLPFTDLLGHYVSAHPKCDQPKPANRFVCECGVVGVGYCLIFAKRQIESMTRVQQQVNDQSKEIQQYREQLASEQEKRRIDLEHILDLDRTNQQLREQLAAAREKLALATQMVQIESKRANEAEQKVQK